MASPVHWWLLLSVIHPPALPGTRLAMIPALQDILFSSRYCKLTCLFYCIAGDLANLAT